MASDIPSETPAVGSVLKNRKAKKAPQGKKYWRGGNFVGFGVIFVVCGTCMSMSIGGSFSYICVMLGLLLFVIGIAVESSVIIYRIIRER